MIGSKEEYRPRCERSRQQLLARVVIVLAASLLVAWVAGCSDVVAEADGLVAGGDLEGAEALYREALASDPEDVDALSGLAVALSLQHKFDEALTVQERVVAADPRDSLTRVELGFNYLNHQGRPEDAVHVLGEAAALDGSAKNLTFLAQAQAAAGHNKDAEQTLERAIQTDPGYEHAYQVLVRLLEEEGRGAEADRVIERAASQGLTLGDP